MKGRCENCYAAIEVSDYAETYKCPECGNISHPEYILSPNPTCRHCDLPLSEHVKGLGKYVCKRTAGR